MEPIRYRVLGPLDILNTTGWTALHTPKWRTLLAVLLVRHNEVVSKHRLKSELWGAELPASADKALQVYVSRLRRALEDPDGSRLITHSPGYLLRVQHGELDLHHFEGLVAAGENSFAAGDYRAAEASLTEALELWRGPAFSDTGDTLTLEAEGERLEERRLAVRDAAFDAGLALGRHRDLLPRMRAIVREHPLRESARARLMIALNRDGRSAEALEVYAAARREIAEELGTDPGPELRQVHQRLLDADSTSQGQGWTPTARSICQLPASVPDFVGRQEELDWLQRALRDSSAAGSRSVLLAGRPGVGKTALAVRAAHAARRLFPDAQLHANLLGHGNRPANPADVLAGFLQSLGVARSSLPEQVDERAAMFRARLADQRVLLVLDDAAAERQVRPLLPGTAGCAALVTSRGRLGGLEGVSRLEVDVLPEQSASELFSSAAWLPRGHGEDAAVTRIVRRCGSLPLALRVAGARLTIGSHDSAARLADDLASEQRRLDGLAVGDLDVRATVSLSYERLSTGARRALRLLGLLRVESAPAWTVSALLDVDLTSAHHLLDELVASNLVDPVDSEADDVGLPRFRLHSLVRLFARERALTEETEQQRCTALRRVFSRYVALTQRADREIRAGLAAEMYDADPAWRLPEPVILELSSSPLRWLRREWPAVCVVVEQAAELDMAELSARLAAAAATFFEIQAHFTAWESTHQVALASCDRTGDRGCAALLQRNLGELHTIQDRYDLAISYFQAARREFHDTREPSGEAATTAGIGLLHRLRGRHRLALDHFGESLELAIREDQPLSQVYARNGIAMVRLERGELDEAAGHFDEGLRSARKLDYLPAQAVALRGLGLVDRAHDRLDDAWERLSTAREITRRIGNRTGSAYAAVWLARLRILRGECDPALSELEGCLTEYTELGNRFGQALTLHNLGHRHLAAHQPQRAAEALGQALARWERMRCPYRLARSFDLLAEAQRGEQQRRAAEQTRGKADRIRADNNLPKPPPRDPYG